MYGAFLHVSLIYHITVYIPNSKLYCRASSSIIYISIYICNYLRYHREREEVKRRKKNTRHPFEEVP